MEYISSAGVAWLARHGLNVDRMIDRWKQGRPVTPQPSWIDNQHDPEAHPKPVGDIAFQKDLWRTHQYLERFSYRELGSRHAKLKSIVYSCRKRCWHRSENRIPNLLASSSIFRWKASPAKRWAKSSGSLISQTIMSNF